MTSEFDDGAPDLAPDLDTTTALDEPTIDPAADEHRLGGTIEYEELTNPDTGNNLEWEVSEGWTDAGTGEPVDYWDSEQTLGDAAPQPHFGESVTARDDDLGHDVEVNFSSPQRSWGVDSEGRDIWRDANGSLHKYE